MKRKNLLRFISCIMCLITVVFVLCASSAPNLGRTFYSGSFYADAEVWRMFYAFYVVIMLILLAASFFVKDNRKNNKE